MNRLDHALALARQGLLIFPLRPGTKRPYRKEDMGGLGWAQYATTDEATIRHWFSTLPDMNYAVSPGDSFVILDPDVDTKRAKDGLATLKEIESEQEIEDWITPQTFEVKSPRGGRHFYLRTKAPVASSVGTFADGIDVRGKLGYVVGPGSKTTANDALHTAEGVYEVVNDVPIMDAPAWVIERAGLKMRRSNDSEVPIFEEDLPFAIERVKQLIQAQTEFPTEGQGGDNATYHFICLVRDQSISVETCFELLTEPVFADGDSWNDKCVPPWNEDELRVKIENAYRYANNRPGVKGGLLDAMSMAGFEYAQELQAETAQREESKGNFLDTLYFPGDKLLQRTEQREYVVQGWILAHGMTQLLAKRGAGKTVTMMDLSLRIACDMDWQGIPIQPGWGVVYCCGEDDLGLQEQYKAWVIQNEITPDEDRFIVMTATPDLMKADQVETWTRYLLGKLKGRKAVLFVDTWQRATSMASQNDEEQMQLATDHAEAMARSMGGPCIIAFHPPKGNENTISGSMVIENKGSAVLRLTNEANHRKLEITRIKGPGEGNFRRFHFDEIGLGEKDTFGKERTGVVPRAFAGTVIEKSNGETETANESELIKLDNQSRFVFACLIRDLFVKAENEEPPENRSSRFTQADTAQRLAKYFESNPQDNFSKKLRAASDSTMLTSAESIRKRLRDLFKVGAICETDEPGTMVKCLKKGVGMKFLVDAV